MFGRAMLKSFSQQVFRIGRCSARNRAPQKLSKVSHTSKFPAIGLDFRPAYPIKLSPNLYKPTNLICKYRLYTSGSLKTELEVETDLQHILEQTSQLQEQINSSESDQPQLLEKLYSSLNEALALSYSRLSEKHVISQMVFLSLLNRYSASQEDAKIVEIVRKYPLMLNSSVKVRVEAGSAYSESLWGISGHEAAVSHSRQHCDYLLELFHQQSSNTQSNGLFIQASDVITSLFNLATMLTMQKNNVEAIDCFSQASKLIQQFSPPSSQVSPLIGLQQSDASSLSLENDISDQLSEAVHTNLSSLLIGEGQTYRAIPHLLQAIYCRERLLSGNTDDLKLREEYIMTMEALSNLYVELGNIEAANICWKRALVVLKEEELKEDPNVLNLPSKLSKSSMEQGKDDIAPKKMAELFLEHGKALLSCSTPETILSATIPLKKAIKLFKELHDSLNLLISLECLSGAYEASSASQAANMDTQTTETQPTSNISSNESDIIEGSIEASDKNNDQISSRPVATTSFTEEQIEIFMECLSINDKIHGTLDMDNARYHNNLAILKSSQNDAKSAEFHLTAASRICEQNNVGAENDILTTTETIAFMLGMTDAMNAIKKGQSTGLAPGGPKKAPTTKRSLSQRKRWKQKNQLHSGISALK